MRFYISKSEKFDKNKDSYISDGVVTLYSQIYKDVGFKALFGSLKKTVNVSPVQLEIFINNIKKSKTIDEPLINQI